MDKKELIETMKSIKDHCENVKGGCRRCSIKKECEANFGHAPTNWELESEVSDEE